MNANATWLVTSEQADRLAGLAWPARAAAAFLAEGLAEVQLAACSSHRREADEDPDGEREPSVKATTMRVHADLTAPRQVRQAPSSRQGSSGSTEPIDQARGRPQTVVRRTVSVSSCLAERRERRAERMARRQLLHPRRRPNEHEVGDVDGADEQARTSTPAHNSRSVARTSRTRSCPEAAVTTGVESGVDEDLLEMREALKVPRVQRVNLLLGERHARARPSGGRPSTSCCCVASRPSFSSAVNGRRHPELDVGIEEVERLRQDADDRVGHAVNAQLLTDRRVPAAGRAAARARKSG